MHTGNHIQPTRRHSRRATLAILTAGITFALIGCTSTTNNSSPAQPDKTDTKASTKLVSTMLTVPTSLADTAPFNQAHTIDLPAGWQASLYARVDGARLAVWSPDKRLLISRPDVGDVQLLTPNSDPAKTPTITTLIKHLTQPHGLAFDKNTLYIAESNRVRAYDYTDGTLAYPRDIITGLPDKSTAELKGAYAHSLKSVTVGTDGAVYVSVGSTGNTSPEDRTASPERASILRVKDGVTTVYAHGVRNGTGLATAPNGDIWTAVNNRDQVAYPYKTGYLSQGDVDPAYVNDHPLEPIAKLTPGRDLGWPYCNPDPDLTPGTKDTAYSYTKRPYVNDQQQNADGSKLDCASLTPPEQGLPAHSAPLGMSFVDEGILPAAYGAGALVAVHGSWNRNPPRAPNVTFLPWKDNTLQAPQTLISGFQDASGNRWGRPVSAVVGPDKAIYITDDLAGAVYRVTTS